jgi:hypothetical protein
MSAPPPVKCSACKHETIRACPTCDKPVCEIHEDRQHHECEVRDGECPECLEQIGNESVRSCRSCGMDVHGECESQHEDYCERWE